MPNPIGQNPQFDNTHWTVILQAADSKSPGAAAALERICSAYWYPLYAYLRRKGHGEHDAADLTQDFFAHLLEKKMLVAANQRRGRFRTFMLTALKNFSVDRRRRDAAVKRGGGAVFLSLDVEDAESRYESESSHGETPEKLFERKWAKAVYARALEALRAEYALGRQADRFQIFVDCLTESNRGPGYEQAAATLGLSRNAFRAANHRFRQRYRELFRAEIARLVDSPEEVDDEMRRIVGELAGEEY